MTIEQMIQTLKLSGLIAVKYKKHDHIPPWLTNPGYDNPLLEEAQWEQVPVRIIKYEYSIL